MNRTSNQEAKAMLKRIQEPEAWEPQINQAAFEALDMAIEALKCSETPKSSEQTAESAQNVSDSDLIFRKMAIETLARMMPRPYTPDGSHPADEEIFRAQEVFADCIEALEILPSAQPEKRTEEGEADGRD